MEKMKNIAFVIFATQVMARSAKYLTLIPVPLYLTKLQAINALPIQAQFKKSKRKIPNSINILIVKLKVLLENYLNDLITDCPSKNKEIPAEEEIYYNLLFYKIKGMPCKNKSMLHCYVDHAKCFTISDLCIFDHDINGNIKICRNGAHLKNCSFYQCSDTFKCFNSYCIPFWKVCDGTWDCPFGEEERDCVSRSCSGLFKCQNSSMCIHFNSMCDSINHCPEKDDELSCSVAVSKRLFLLVASSMVSRTQSC